MTQLYERIKADYIAHRHLSNADAARAMGRTESAVKDYRKHHPESRSEGYGQHSAKPQRPAYVPPRADVRRVTVASAGASSTQFGISTVSLPREPWMPA